MIGMKEDCRKYVYLKLNCYYVTLDHYLQLHAFSLFNLNKMRMRRTSKSPFCLISFQSLI